MPICPLPGSAASAPAAAPATAAIETRVAAEAPDARPVPSGTSGVVPVLFSTMQITLPDAEDRTYGIGCRPGERPEALPAGG
jgi:hypothetical protein